MRTYIKKKYDFPKWRNKVDHMSDQQVWSIYQSMVKKQKAKEKAEQENHQITIDEFMNELWRDKK